MSTVVSITASQSEVNMGDTVTFTIVNNNDSTMVIGEDCTVYLGGRPNNTGIINPIEIYSGKVPEGTSKSFDYTFTSAGEFRIRVSFGGVVGDVDVDVNPIYMLTPSSNSYEVEDGDVTVQFTLTYGNPVAGEIITLTDPEDNSVTATTNSNGVATFNLTGITESGVYTASYGSVTANVNIVVHDYDLSFDAASYVTCNGNATVSATLTDNNSPVAGETVTLTGAGASALTATTGSDGVAYFSLTGVNSNKSLTVTWDNLTDSATLTYNNPNTLNGSLICLGRKMANNLKAKGVSNADESDGLNTLANKILNIPASVGGIELVTAITCASSENSVTVGDTITLTGVLEADFDDTSSSNVDLEGFLSGAVVKFYNGQTLLGSAVTNSQGAYSFNYTPDTPGTLVLAAVFEGTTYYNACTSSTVSVNVDYDITITVDKPILSAYDNETATITAGCGVAGETLSYSIEDSGGNVIDSGSDTTDSNGEITFTYAAAARGDVTVNVSLRSLLTETYVIEDCIDYDSLTSDSGKWDFPSGTTVQYSSDGMRISASAWKDGYFNGVYDKPYCIEVDLMDYTASGNNTFYMIIYFYNDSKIRLAQAQTINNGKTAIGPYSGGSASEVWYTIPKGSHVKILVESNLMSLYVDDVLKVSSTYDLPSKSIVGVSTASDRSTTYKNWKIKAL